MTTYEQEAKKALDEWAGRMLRRPSLLNRLSKRMQTKVNSYIPEKVHKAITTAIKQMVRSVLFGAVHTAARTRSFSSFEEQEAAVAQLINQYKHTAAAEGGITGAGGLLLSLADFPILLGLKLKMLFDIAALYGIDVKDYRERVYILYIFQLAFSSQQHRRTIFLLVQHWEETRQSLPADLHQFDWRSLQQEYRDFIDLAKMAQLIPGVGAVVGFVANYQLVQNLGKTAMNAYRLRLLPAAPGTLPNA